MTTFERRTYARKLMIQHARAVEFLTIIELAEPGISDEDAALVHDLIACASITIKFPGDA